CARSSCRLHDSCTTLRVYVRCRDELGSADGAVGAGERWVLSHALLRCRAAEDLRPLLDRVMVAREGVASLELALVKLARFVAVDVDAFRRRFQPHLTPEGIGAFDAQLIPAARFRDRDQRLRDLR